MDTRRAAAQSVQLGYAHGGFDADDIRRKLFPLLSPDAGFVYGSGFETQPELLAEIAERCRLWGNHPKTVEVVKDPDRFFSLLTALDTPFPETTLSAPARSDGWLSKRIGGSGGTHIVSMTEAGGAQRYYQRMMPGRPCSLLFLANGRDICPVGFNEQYLAPLPEMPYRYGGAASRAILPARVRVAMLRAAEQLTAHLQLYGLNSLDCLVHEDDMQLLEVNPRLSATFALYDVAHSGAGLLQAHLDACDGRLPPALPAEQAQAHLIYYAPFDLALPASMAWPKWVADVPRQPAQVAAGEPLCTVLAAAENADAAHDLAQMRIAALTQMIINS